MFYEQDNDYNTCCSVHVYYVHGVVHICMYNRTYADLQISSSRTVQHCKTATNVDLKIIIIKKCRRLTEASFSSSGSFFLFRAFLTSRLFLQRRHYDG